MLRFAAVLLIGLSAPLQAQTGPRVQPGGVATLVVTLPGAADSVPWSLRPAPGVRVYSALAGTAAAGSGTAVHLPFTFGIPSRAHAGRMVVAELVLEAAADRREVRELLVEVLPRRGAAFWTGQEALAAPAGASAEVAFRLRNDGNAVDTFHVRLTGPSAWPGASQTLTMVVPPGQEDSAAFHAEIPRTASGGDEHVLRIALTGTDVRESRSVRLVVLTPEPAVGNLTTLPGTIFVGSSSGESGGAPAAALTAAGDLRPGLRMSLALRHVHDLSPAHGFRADLSGPRLRIGLEADHWNARAGDIFSLPDLLAGPATHGRGLEAAFEPGDWRADIFLARPWSYHADAGDGHIFRGGARRATPHGTFGLRASSVAREGDLLGASRQRGAAVTYALRAGAHDVHAEVGVLEVAGDSMARAGAAAQLQYAVSRGRVSIAARLRRVPGTTARTASQGNEASGYGSYRLTEAVSLTGSAYATAAPRVDGGPYGASRGGAAGIRLDLRGGLSGRATARYRSTEHVGGTVPGTETRAVQLGASVPVGAIALEAEADVGENAGPLGHEFLTARMGARWQADRRWLWAGLSRHAGGFGPAQAGLDLAGATRLAGAEIQGGLSARLNGADRLRSTSFWSAAAVPVARGTTLSAGVDFRGYAPSPLRFSLGIRRSFGLPVPVPRRPIVEGVIFEDLDGDGNRSPGEPPLPNLGVSLGVVRTTTDEDGRFRFFEGRRDRLRVDPRDLPLGVAVRADAAPGSGRKADIAVVRTASVEVTTFMDRDGDEHRDAGEEAAAGALVSILETDGTRRDAVADASGRVRFSGLRPGNYTLIVQRLEGRGPGTTVERTVVLAPGVTDRVQVAVPLRTRDIRMPGGMRLEDAPPPSAPAPRVETATTEALTRLPSSAARPRTPPAPASRQEPGANVAAPADSVAAASPDGPTGADGSGSPDTVAPEASDPKTGGTGPGIMVAALLLTPGMAAFWLRLRLVRPATASGPVVSAPRA